MQESIAKQVKMPVNGGSHPNTVPKPGKSTEKEPWERKTERLAPSLNQYMRDAIDYSLHL